MQEWYYLVDDGEQIGPFSEQEMVQLYSEEKIHSETYVWKEEMTEWVYFRESRLFKDPSIEKTNVNQDSQPEVTRMNRKKRNNSTINTYLRAVYGEIFKKHSQEEGERLFIASMTTASSNVNEDWPKPWLFSRVFLVLMITYIVLFTSANLFYHPNFLPGLMMVSAFTIPFLLIIFFWEMNASHSIRLIEVIKIFFVGGVLSFLFSWLPITDLRFFNAMTTGAFIELGKLIAIAYFIYRLNARFVVNGLLIGTVIGAAFSGFENLGYALNVFQADGGEAMRDVLFHLSWMSVGSHTAWGAITGGALSLVKGNERLTRRHFTNPVFLKYFSVTIALHMMWNTSIFLFGHFFLSHIILAITAWIFIFMIIKEGLQQLSQRDFSYGMPKSKGM
ncbi:RsiW-degrading membrane proteinase PrsW (M82 family) [Geomicrobium halophilum]|uniref:RsiW-degrading membrane proteinase PrsW (M82 family) n=1 Tax=Geomicrobium halophilum TaxID=549000 RepID=A0A841PMU3_9BACL|nr:GYF domain-containing protein [Geomicrobium halophilum]MBB6448536.1 RsiW-degrading membrane proteinase PrsW (M82 family) [Geomicrobium halophilum]